MSIVAPRRTWLLPAGLGACALVVAASVALLLLWRHPQGATGGQPFSAAPAAEQAPWRVKSFAAGALGKIAGDAKATAERQLSDVEKLVRGVYDAELMNPRDLPKVVEKSFTQSAAASFERARLGVPKGATDVTSTKRAARIGVNVAGARSASAEVTISVVGRLKGETLRLDQRSTLWMQRLDGRWKVVGYDVAQGPPEAAAGKAGKSGRGNGKAAGKSGK